jgi:hypothetical protein
VTLTVHAPDVELAPAALSETLHLGNLLTRTLALSNGGPGDLDLRLVEARAALPAGVGPDPFGYTYLDSNQPGGPAYNWIEIAPPAGGSGTELEALTGASAGYAYPIPLPFTFHFYGADYDALAVHADGLLSWSNRSASADNRPIPSAREFEITAFLAPFWDDLAVDPGAIYLRDLGSAFLIEYHRVSRQADRSDPGDWQILLYPSGSILFQYRDVDLGGVASDGGQTATVGIQGDALSGLQYSYNAPALSPGLAICFAPPGQRPDCSPAQDLPWLSVSPASAAVAPGSQHPVDLVLDARPPHLAAPGLYRAALVALTNDPQRPLLSLPITLTVLPPAPPRTLYLPLLLNP